MTAKINKEIENKKAKKTLLGIVVSDKMNKTVVVSVSHFIEHPKYGNFYKDSKKYKAHDENNEYKIGNKVEIISTRPISKDKKFAVVQRIK